MQVFKQTMLKNLRDELVLEIGKKQQAGDYATADALQVVSDELESLKNDSYTKAEIDKKITDAVTNGQVSLDDYATTAALTEMETALTALIDKKVLRFSIWELRVLQLLRLYLRLFQEFFALYM